MNSNAEHVAQKSSYNTDGFSLELGKKAYVSGNEVRVRSEPTLTSKIVDALGFATQVTVTDYGDNLQAIDGERRTWYKVNYQTSAGKKKSGWIYGSYLSQDVLKSGAQIAIFQPKGSTSDENLKMVVRIGVIGTVHDELVIVDTYPERSYSISQIPCNQVANCDWVIKLLLDYTTCVHLEHEYVILINHQKMFLLPKLQSESAGDIDQDWSETQYYKFTDKIQLVKESVVGFKTGKKEGKEDKSITYNVVEKIGNAYKAKEQESH